MGNSLRPFEAIHRRADQLHCGADRAREGCESEHPWQHVVPPAREVRQEHPEGHEPQEADTDGQLPPRHRKPGANPIYDAEIFTDQLAPTPRCRCVPRIVSRHRDRLPQLAGIPAVMPAAPSGARGTASIAIRRLRGTHPSSRGPAAPEGQGCAATSATQRAPRHRAGRGRGSGSQGPPKGPRHLFRQQYARLHRARFA